MRSRGISPRAVEHAGTQTKGAAGAAPFTRTCGDLRSKVVLCHFRRRDTKPTAATPKQRSIALVPPSGSELPPMYPVVIPPLRFETTSAAKKTEFPLFDEPTAKFSGFKLPALFVITKVTKLGFVIWPVWQVPLGHAIP